jgi:predicted ATP-grasp superfamily ATP-dependent carboligase
MTSDLPPPVALLVLTNTDWYGLARAPRALADAGFRVRVIGPPTHLIMRSRYIEQGFSHAARPGQDAFLSQLAEVITTTQPRLVLPGDDLASGLLHELHRRSLSDPPLKTVLDASLAPLRHQRSLERKSRQVKIAHRLGIAVPPSIINPDRDGALAFAAAYGYPVLVKLDHSWAGRGVIICDDAASLVAALDHVPPAIQLYPKVDRTVQAYIRGTGALVTWSAHGGTLLDSFALTKLVQHGLGPTTVATILDDDGMLLDIARRLIAEFAVTGVGDVEFRLGAGTGRPYFIEMNPRWVPVAHLGGRLGHDLLGPLARRFGAPPPADQQRLPPITGPIAVFPTEWLRDPASPYLVQAHHDVPWDEPELIRGLMQALNRGGGTHAMMFAPPST